MFQSIRLLRKPQKKTLRLELPIVEKRQKRTYALAARKLKTSTRVKKMLAGNNKAEPKVHNTPSEAFFNSVRMAAKWEEKKYDYVDAYLTSICNGLPLKNAVDLAAVPEGPKVIDIPTCRCRDLAETLLMMQMFPKKLSNVKAAIHFVCLDLFDMLELRAQVSTTVFAEVLNQINMFETSDVVSYMVDGCASLKRKKTSDLEIDLYKLQKAGRLWIQQSAFHRFGENEQADTVIRNIDSQIKADSGRDMKRDMAINGIIAVVCTHGVAKKLIDMKQGERHVYTLATLSSIAEEKEASGDEDLATLIFISFLCSLNLK
ncbi:hypothetical protein [Parasitella parasitica]|uniref:Uncharacterized protein n=1 Tax=Parasitella parasitica TaxID=35722 RepID=A0A0B7NSS4_9FUNG|nr:hypothetical protein [Parasitella parasitica]